MVDQVVENADFELALREQLNKHGEFKKGSDGALEWASYLALRLAITRQVARGMATRSA
jgi:hypothetical protein